MRTEFVKKVSYSNLGSNSIEHSNRYIPGTENDRFFWSFKYWN